MAIRVIRAATIEMEAATRTLKAEISANEAKACALEAKIKAIEAENSVFKAKRQRFDEELVWGAQQSGRRAEDGVLYRIREELLDLGLKVREDLTLEQLETEGLAYQINGCWILAWDYVVEIYLPAKRRARNADPAQ